MKRTRRPFETAARTLLSGIGLCQSLTAIAGDVPAMAPASVQTAPAGIELPPELREPGKWTAFKALWRKLGDSNSISSEQAYAFRQELAAIVVPGAPRYGCWPWGKADGAELKLPCHEDAQNAAISIETRMLVKLLELRIENMKDGPRLPRGPIMTRMMPRFGEVPPSKWMFERLNRIEARLDALEALRVGGSLDPEVAGETLQALVADANFVLQLDALAETPLLFDVVLKARDFPKGKVPVAGKDGPDDVVWEKAAEANVRRPVKDMYRIFGSAQESKEASLSSLKAWLAEMRGAHGRLLPLLGELER